MTNELCSRVEAGEVRKLFSGMIHGRQQFIRLAKEDGQSWFPLFLNLIMNKLSTHGIWLNVSVS